MAKPLYDISPFTLLDYPDKTACIFWFVGCNMRCLYCYNPDIVFGKGKISLDDAINFLISRKELLQAVVFSGGECSAHPDLLVMARKAKSLGYLVKVDTNGLRPDVITKMLKEGLIDYVSLDFKGLGENFKKITGSTSFGKFEETLFLLLDTDMPFEVRTTVHSQLLSPHDLMEMLSYLESCSYRGNYYLQPSLNNVKMISELNHSTFDSDILKLKSKNINIKLRK